MQSTHMMCVPMAELSHPCVSRSSTAVQQSAARRLARVVARVKSCQPQAGQARPRGASRQRRKAKGQGSRSRGQPRAARRRRRRELGRCVWEMGAEPGGTCGTARKADNERESASGRVERRLTAGSTVVTRFSFSVSLEPQRHTRESERERGGRREPRQELPGRPSRGQTNFPTTVRARGSGSHLSQHGTCADPLRRARP